MSQSNNNNVPETSTIPSIRCPGCGNNVALPATTCNSCGYNFREGKAPPPVLETELPGSRHTFFIAAGLVVVLIIIACFIFSGGKKELPATPPNAANEPGLLQPMPPLSESPLLRPQVPIGQAKSVAEQADRNVQLMEELHQENQSGQ